MTTIHGHRIEYTAQPQIVINRPRGMPLICTAEELDSTIDEARERLVSQQEWLEVLEAAKAAMVNAEEATA